MSQGGVFPSIPTKGKAVFTLGKLLRFLEKLSVGLAVMVWIKRLCQRLNYAIKSRKQIILVADINFWKETGLAVLSHIKTAQSKHWKKIPSPSTPLGRKLFCLAPLIFHLNSVTSWGSFPFSIFAHSDWYILPVFWTLLNFVLCVVKKSRYARALQSNLFDCELYFWVSLGVRFVLMSVMSICWCSP